MTVTFRASFELSLWLNLIFCTIGGGVFFHFLTRTGTRGWGGAVSYEANIGLIFLGIIIGLIVGIMTNISYGGLMAIFINIDDNLEKLANK